MSEIPPGLYGVGDETADGHRAGANGASGDIDVKDACKQGGPWSTFGLGFVEPFWGGGTEAGQIELGGARSYVVA